MLSSDRTPAAPPDSGRAEGAAAAGADEALARGQQIGRFVVVRLLGRGAMGEVYAAYDPALARTVAVKLLRAEQGADSAEGRARLMREAQAIARVSHPNVVVVYETGMLGDRVFIAMEHVEGTTLAWWIHARPRTWPEVLEVFLTAGRGLAAAHERNLVHRDFKPDNVMIGADGQVRVMDFGLVQMAGADGGDAAPTDGGSAGALADLGTPESLLATRPLGASASTAGDSAPALSSDGGSAGAELTQTGVRLGTPAYMSPEQFAGRPTDARADQFAFCVALYEALYGERPFAGRTLVHLTLRVLEGKVRDEPPGSKVPAFVRAALLRGLRVDPAARWPSMAALLAELEKEEAVSSRRRFAAAAAARLAGVWEAPRGDVAIETTQKADMRRAFLATGKAYAAQAFATTAQILDRYARRWTDLYVEACEATHVRGEHSAEVLDLRMACLRDALEDLRALCAELSRAGPEAVERAVAAANALGGLDRCENVELLRAMVRPPADGAAAEAVAHLRSRLAQARAVARLGRFQDAAAAIGPIASEARTVAYAPLLAEVLLAGGALDAERGALPEATAALEEAVWVGIESRHDEAAAEAATCLVWVDGAALARFEAAEVWSRLAEALIRRMGGRDLLHGWLLNNRAAMREVQGRFAEGLEDARRSLAAKERVLEPNDPDIGASLTNVALFLDGLGQLAEAVAHGARAVQVTEEGQGPDHPHTARALSNHAEYLLRSGLFDQAGEPAARALAIFERETDPEGLYVTYPLLVLGLADLGRGRVAQALPLLARAHRIREAREPAPARRAEARFALARALWEAEAETEQGRDRARAHALAVEARADYERSPPSPAVARELATVNAWLAGR